MEHFQDETLHGELNEQDFWDQVIANIGDDQGRKIERMINNSPRNRMLIHGIDFGQKDARDLDLEGVDEVYETNVKPDSWHLVPKYSTTERYNAMGTDWNRTERSPNALADDGAIPGFDIQVYNMGYELAPETIRDEVDQKLLSERSNNVVAYIVPQESDYSVSEFEGEAYEFESGAEAMIMKR